MTPLTVGGDINYNIIATANSWIRNSNSRSTCYRIHDEGLLVADQTPYGKYGGDEEKPA